MENALDIACGTGLSTKALSEIAIKVYGTDISSEMLNNVFVDNKITYLNSIAEEQPFSDEYFDIITVCSAVHWFDIDTFLMESNRLLKKNSWLILYDNFFISEMEKTPLFNNWYKEIYLKMFPAPKRNNNYYWSIENIKHKGFISYFEQEFKNPIDFTKKDLILYLTTQSNITNVIEGKKANYPEIEKWLDLELSKFYSNEDETKTIYYGNWIKYLQK